METLSTYKYYAFISYKSEDEKWAKKLQEDIEKYRLPAYLCKKYPTSSKRLKPCFRYHTDIGINELKQELNEKLEKSKFLIIVSSPKSAKSEWVGEEIETFVRLGRKSSIIPFIVDGVPYSDDENECLHPSIKKQFPRSDSHEDDKEILGANVNEEGREGRRIKWNKAVVKVIAKMLELEFDELWQREKRRKVRNALWWTTGLMTIFVAFLSVIINSQPFDMNLKLSERSMHNDNLPPLKNAAITLFLDDKKGTDILKDTLRTFESTVVFKHIPHKYLNKPMKIHVSCQAFLSVDTVIELTKDIELGIARDPSYYGDVHFRIFNPSTEEFVPNLSFDIDGHTVSSDANGLVSLFIPLAEQKRKYPVSSSIPLHQNCIYMPCGEDDCIHAKN